MSVSSRPSGEDFDLPDDRRSIAVVPATHEGSTPRFAHTKSDDSGKLSRTRTTVLHEDSERSDKDSKPQLTFRNIQSQQGFTFKDYSTIESLEAGAAIMAQRRRLLDAMPSVKPKVDQILRKAEKELSAAGQTVVEKAVKDVVQAYNLADKAKAVATRSGVPPDHPDFCGVAEIEEKLDRYMSEAVRLHNLSKSYKKEIQYWRTEVAELGAQRPSLLATYKTAKRESQLFEAVSRGPDDSRPHTARSSGASTSMLTPSRPSTEPGEKRPGRSRSGLRPRGESFGDRASTAPAATGASGQAFQDHFSQASAAGSDNVQSPAVASNAHPAGSGGASERSKALKDVLSKLEQSELEQTLLPTRGQTDKEAQYLQEIKSMEAKLKHAKQEVSKLRDAQCGTIVRRHWVEEFFLLCMDDLRKEFQHRTRPGSSKQGSRPTTRGTLAGRPPSRPDTRLTISSCCESRRGGSTSAEVLEVLMSSEEVLAFLFEKMFPHRGAFFNIKRRDGGLSISGAVSKLLAGQGHTTERLPDLPRIWSPDEASQE